MSNSQGAPRRPMYDQDARASGPAAAAEPPRRRTSPGVPSPGVAAVRAASGGAATAVRRPPATRQSNATATRRPPASSPARSTAPTTRRPNPPKRGGAAAKKRRKGNSLAMVGFILLAIVLLLGVTVFAVYNVYKARMDGRGTGQGVTPEQNKTHNLFPEYAGKGIVNFLVCGIDYDNDTADGYATIDKIGRTDMILYCHYDTVNNKLSIMQFPRDTFIGEDAATGNRYRLNALYYNSPDPDNRVAALSQVLADQFKLPVDFYITIDMDAVKEIIDIRGSIEVYVPVPIDDPRYPDTFIPAGWNYFDGAQAEVLLRNRHSTAYNDQGDIARLNTQLYFYSALFREFTALAPQDLIMWIDVLSYRVKTEQSPLQLGSLATKALNLTAEDIVFVRPPCGPVTYKGQSVVSLVADETADLLNRYFRADGHVVPVDELDIRELQMYLGVSPTTIKTMTDIQGTEGEKTE